MRCWSKARCAGYGYRALRRAELPPGGRLGLYGFGGSVHLTAQVALAQGATVHVLTRLAADQALTRELGASEASWDIYGQKVPYIHQNGAGSGDGSTQSEPSWGTANGAQARGL